MKQAWLNREAKNRVIQSLTGFLRSSLDGNGPIDLKVDYKGDPLDDEAREATRHAAEELLQEMTQKVSI
jgi:hypothetical protein